MLDNPLHQHHAVPLDRREGETPRPGHRADLRVEFRPLRTLAVDEDGLVQRTALLAALRPDCGTVVAWEIAVGTSAGALCRALSDLIDALPCYEPAVARVAMGLDTKPLRAAAAALGLQVIFTSKPPGYGMRALADVAERMIEQAAAPSRGR